MKILFFSDLHGSAAALESLAARCAELAPDELISLGDLLYHGPRNGLFPAYDPRRTAELLNDWTPLPSAVRGNCDAEVDQQMLAFPILAEYALLLVDGRRFFLTHGHHWNEQNPPPAPAGTILTHGHTHIHELKVLPGGGVLFNPGSLALPKRGQAPSFGWYEAGVLSIRALADGSVMERLTLP